MPQPRKHQICLADTPFYHCISRCVRRAYLCGKDKLTGRSYEHRRKWVENRLLLLGQVFAVDICAYAVMHNHTHVVLHINEKQASSWTDEEVLVRWQKLHKGMICCRKYLNDKERSSLSDAELDTVSRMAKVYRKRLCDVSWFMRLLNEFIARKANQEDDCTGRFWEGRFKSQALLDEAALFACMAYVDLNPVRAGIASSPESADFTSLKKRILLSRQGKPLKPLMPFTQTNMNRQENTLNITFSDYIELIKSTLEAKRRAGNKGFSELHSKISGFDVNVESWQCMSFEIEKRFGAKVSVEIANRRLTVV